jgi:hypothetical protein
LPQGSIVTRGKISIQPVLEETVHESGQPVTHLTGASSEGNTIIEGTGIYENSTGNIRLSDMVDMSNFEMNEGDLLSFNCLFGAHFFEVFTLHDFTKNEWNTFLIATTIFTCPIQISAVAVWIEQKIQSKLSIAAHYPAKKIPKHNIRNQAIPTAQHKKNT